MTDTELKLRYDGLMKELRKLEKKKTLSDSDKAKLDELKREVTFAARDWQEIVERKKSGQLTDSTKIDVIKAEFTEPSKWHRVPIGTVLAEGPHDEELGGHPIARYWELKVMYAGAKDDLNLTQWRHFADEVIQALKQKKLIKNGQYSEGLTRNEQEYEEWIASDDDEDDEKEYDTDDEADVDEIEDDEVSEGNKPWRPCIRFTVNVWVWGGPGDSPEFANMLK
jgi:hypothetical protein